MLKITYTMKDSTKGVSEFADFNNIIFDEEKAYFTVKGYSRIIETSRIQSIVNKY